MTDRHEVDLTKQIAAHSPDGCPAGCGRTVRQGHLMCGPCWREVPKHLQLDVHRTWRTWRRDFGDLDAFHAYKAASDAAVGSVP